MMSIHKKYIIAIILVIFTLSIAYFMQPEPEMREKEESETDVVELPQPVTSGDLSVESAINQRRSIRKYTEEPLTLKQVSQLMWSAQGITGEAGMKRTAPSAGGKYPLEVYLVAGRDGVEGLEAGVYHYIPEEHELKVHLSGDVQSDLAGAALGQEWVREAPVDIVIAGVFERTMEKYGERGRQYVHMEAGHAGQNLYLQCESLGLGMVVTGGFRDGQVKDVLKLPEDHEPLYVIPVGYPS